MISGKATKLLSILLLAASSCNSYTSKIKPTKLSTVCILPYYRQTNGKTKVLLMTNQMQEWTDFCTKSAHQSYNTAYAAFMSSTGFMMKTYAPARGTPYASAVIDLPDQTITTYFIPVHFVHTNDIVRRTGKQGVDFSWFDAEQLKNGALEVNLLSTFKATIQDSTAQHQLEQIIIDSYAHAVRR
jgi:hypothetical protein